VIKTASQLDLDGAVDNPEKPGEFQRNIEGLVFGESVQSDRAEDRFYHNKLGFTFEQPPGWTVDATAQAIVARAPDGGAVLTITIRRRDPAVTPRDLLERSGAEGFNNGTALDQAGLKGYTATNSGNRRLAVIDYNNLSYLFEGQAQNGSSADAVMLSMIQSFRPMHPREFGTNSGHHVHYIQVPRGATIDSLSTGLRIPDAGDQLRLLNGLYPQGEPRTGDWIKTIR
jgi:predicted Zn-dependent protease